MDNDRFDGLDWGDEPFEEPDPHAAALAAFTWSEAVRASIRIRMP